MRNHRKDKKITLLEVASITNENGFDEEVCRPVQGAENIWAYYRHISGTEFFAAATTNSKVEAIFEIKWREGIDTDMKVLYNHKEYCITQIDDFEGKKTNLKLYAKRLEV